jgi:hypothetical protein
MSIENDPKRVSNSAFDESKREGQEPLEEVGPDESQDKASECETQIGELEGQPGACEIKHDEEVYDAFPVEEIPLVIDPTDGMPRPSDVNDELPLAQPFTYENVNCIEDDRQYVEVFYGEFNEKELPLIPASLGIAYRTKHDQDGKERERRCFSPDLVQRVVGLFVVPMDPNDSSYREGGRLSGSHITDSPRKYWYVRPIRPRCKHYKRQVFANDGIAKGDYGHCLVFRNCTTRRSVGGAFMSLRDEAVYACDYRDPPDLVSVEKYLDAPDRKKLSERPDLVLVPLFGMDGDETDVKEKESGT